MTTQPISFHFSIVTDAEGRVKDVLPSLQDDGEKVVIDRSTVKGSSKGCVKRSDGEVLAKRIRDAMEDRNLTVQQVAKAAKISTMSFYKYLRLPGTAPLGALLRMCKAAGIQQVTVQTSGTYYEK